MPTFYTLRTELANKQSYKMYFILKKHIK